MQGRFPEGFHTDGKVAVIGDIHGRSDALRAALEAIRDPAETELILLGDYVDRGPDSRGVLEILNRLEQYAQFKNIVILPGNHDGMVFYGAYACEDSYQTWIYNSGDLVALREFPMTDNRVAIKQLAEEMPDQLKRRMLIDGMRPWHQNGNLLFVHAGVNPIVDPAAFLNAPYVHPRREYDSWAWIRDGFLDHDGGFNGPDGNDVFVVHGHTRLNGKTADQLIESAVKTSRLNRMGLDASGTEGVLLLQAEGNEFSLDFVQPHPAYENWLEQKIT